MYDIMLLCLAINIYHEARGESVVGQQAVAYVTLNRSLGVNRDVCDAVSEDQQFSWTIGKMKKVEGRVDGFTFNRELIPPKTKQWEDILSVARKELSSYTPINSRYSTWTHYHEESVRPAWIRDKEKTFVGKIDRHMFYTDANFVARMKAARKASLEENKRAQGDIR